ncbi:hypothetical protein GCM10011507_34920 [Edaphobacter acidisoli]|uniref:Uncharacterized protein n=1 Tax=Edaphobacter acidisoli TaxID=2040573 RepID=A0A916WA90_9BACT|nr:phage head-tail connector protein [Edaphobacter acidisoli]GGA80720.1 hypothetical protein GCM10011507_34920 [Edaphobacter acidisoli]
MNEIIQIAAPLAEPVSVAEMMLQLGLGTPADSTLNSQLTSQLTTLLLAARQYCENYTRTAFMTQTWLLQRDSWPFVDGRYRTGGAFNAAFRLPKPPFQSIAFMRYVDVDGNIQPLTQSTDYGSNPNDPIYGYQLDPGSDTRPARLLPPWAKPWPPLRYVANAVMVQFKCGYGGSVPASMAANSPILVGPVFNAGDVGQAVSVPGAGTAAANLVTTIASVDENGRATLAASATVAVTNVSAYVGQPVPESVRQAIKFMAAFFFQNGVDVDLPTPRIIAELLEMYRNRVA